MCVKDQKQVLLTTEYLDEKLSSLIGYMDVRFENIESRLDGIDLRLDKIESRLDEVEFRLDKVEARLDKIEERLDNHEDRFDRLEKHIDFKFDFFKGDIIRSLEPMFADMRVDLLGYKDSMVTRTMDIEVEQLALGSALERNSEILDNHEKRIKKLELKSLDNG